ncbi:hypothetical protein [Pelagicoccus sp. SDUM812005]|uniref:hypothetical protein n=1 Tax=Pelagicoccus sp. SDUM812005 TaxID=3041257 RepID=UPI00280D1D12|nr:hypothetical protein [Pelagicoccus sp. SDUM812005]MDQ8181111.1 hypothetical protein [Pelagicoccus sp. SDUM812005]
MNHNTTTEPETDIEDSNHTTHSAERSNSDWLAERKRELREVLEKKSKALSKQAQESLSQKLGRYHSALNKASESLESDSEEETAKITANLAEQIKSSADYIKNTPPEQLADQATERVRRAPFLALGAAVAVGFLAGRVICSARDESDTSN